MAKKKNKSNKRYLKKKQRRYVKASRRRKAYKKSKAEGTTIHWDDLMFLSTWKSLTPEDLMEKCFQFDVDEWIIEFVNPKKDEDFHELQQIEGVRYWIDKTFDSSLEAWCADTNGFTEKIPERYSFYSEKNQTKFWSIIRSTEHWEESLVDSMLEMIENRRHEWFAVVFADVLDEMIDRISTYVHLSILSMSHE